LRGRGATTPKRHARKYLDYFDCIWSLQSFLLSEADRHDTAIVANDDLEKATRQVIVTINRELAGHFHGAPGDAFGEFAEALLAEHDSSRWQRLVPELINQ
jgi:2-phosphoglycerate kinase